MTYSEIFETVKAHLVEILEQPDVVVTDETSARDIPEWDSLLHIQLIFELEKTFKIRFTAMEIGHYENVGQLCMGIEKKI
jgi:acyl carrier protein